MESTNTSYNRLRLVLGDQLNSDHHWYQSVDADVLYVIAELQQETGYVRHHIQKICAFFAAMERFADTLASKGHQVLHLTLDQTIEHENLPALLGALAERFGSTRIEYQQPDEYRLRRQLESMSLDPAIAISACDTEHFLLPESELDDYITANKHNRMESFYRRMRRRFDLLMDGEEPLGGQWNFDADNREKLRPVDLAAIPAPLCFENPVEAILERLARHGIDHFGKIPSALIWPVDREQSLSLLEHFCRHCLPCFGRFQDAMTADHEYRWSLYHSRLSFALNSKLLHPMEVINAAVSRFDDGSGDVSLAQIEGFVRQIIGWREYVRAVYWVNMPDYARRNQLEAKRDLPAYFWTGETRMRCMRESIGQSLDYAYAHHIQRLMITGNFCLLTGIDPDQVDAWYLGIYIDAIEWVEMPNTRGMSQFADGGLIATKPYSSGGNYINKMSDYCKGCHYDVKQKTGETSCPFNSLYWGFMDRHRRRLQTNPRIGMIYRSWDRQDEAQRSATLERADWCLQNLEDL